MRERPKISARMSRDYVHPGERFAVEVTFGVKAKTPIDGVKISLQGRRSAVETFHSSVWASESMVLI